METTNDLKNFIFLFLGHLEKSQKVVILTAIWNRRIASCASLCSNELSKVKGSKLLNPFSATSADKHAVKSNAGTNSKNDGNTNKENSTAGSDSSKSPETSPSDDLAASSSLLDQDSSDDGDKKKAASQPSPTESVTPSVPLPPIAKKEPKPSSSAVAAAAAAAAASASKRNIFLLNVSFIIHVFKIVNLLKVILNVIFRTNDVNQLVIASKCIEL